MSVLVEAGILENVSDTLEETLFRRDGKCKSVSAAENRLLRQLWLDWKPARSGKSWDGANNLLDEPIW